MDGGRIYRSANAGHGGPRPVDDATLVSADPLVNQPVVEAASPPPEPPAEGSAAGNSAIMALGSLVSRGTGFLRNLMIGAALGGAVVVDAYTTAQVFPVMV